MTILRGIQPGELDELWPIAAALLAEGLRHGAGYRWTLEALKASIAENRRHLWLTWPGCEAAAVTEIEDYPASRVLTIRWLCGRLPANWRELLGCLERWGAEMGCAEIDTGGRAGWQRKLSGAGYRPAPWTTLTKRTQHAQRR